MPVASRLATKLQMQLRWVVCLVIIPAAWCGSGLAQSPGPRELPSAAFPGPPNALSAGSFSPLAEAQSSSVHTDPVPANAAALYRQLSQVGLDPHRVFHIREASLDRESLHVTLEDGTIAFTEDVLGRPTGAFFVGDGEILLVPSGHAEQLSMGLFAGAKVLEERFSAAYLRFNDDTFDQLRPYLRTPVDGEEFYDSWKDAVRNLAGTEALRLFVDFSLGLPASGTADAGVPPAPHFLPVATPRLLHMRITGSRLGTFDVIYDQSARERISVAQLAATQGASFYDLWTSFSPAVRGAPAAKDPEDPVRVSQFHLLLQVLPPRQLNADATLDATVSQGGQRTLLFELSRFLQVEKVEWNGAAVGFLHNPAMEGTQLARRGNDVVAVVFPRELKAGEVLRLHFVYQGEVLSEAATGLLYVGERGTWYPNRGLAMANFDMEFRYPPEWKLVATGQRVPTTTLEENRPALATEQVSRWVTELPIPVAGFNLGKYESRSAQAGPVKITAYATQKVEDSFPLMVPKDVLPDGRSHDTLTVLSAPSAPSPARNAQMVADQAAQAVQYFGQQFGPYPYRSLLLTQIPGSLSQGWPGLVFLSTYAFLTPQERTNIGMAAPQSLLDSIVVAHETAHQWWGDLVLWGSYRDQWIVEALANYSALLLAENSRPADVRAILDNYRAELLKKGSNGLPAKDAGAVTLGVRLTSSKFPDGYAAISYGRGTWLFHMLRSMLRDGSELAAHGATGENPQAVTVVEPGTVTGVATNGATSDAASDATSDALFLRDLRRLREQYAGRTVTTKDLQAVFEQDLPPALWFEGKPSLEWFFEGWVNGTAIPRLRLTGEKLLPRNGSVQASGTIQQLNAPPDLVTPVSVFAEMPDRSLKLVGLVLADGDQTSFRLNAPAGTRRLLLDPEDNMLTELH